MIKSMTGYGRAVQTFENREITVEIRSVNNRYLDCSVKLPRVFGFAEDSVKAKVKEGAALEADLRSRAKTVLGLVEKVEARSPVTLAEYRARLTQKMQEVLQNTNIDEGRILQEAAIYADKIAVDEETVRLRSHLAQLDAMLTAGGAIGRKLDFLLQEFNREANTIGSKGNDLEQARTVVEIKAELEKIREQTQNIE